MVRLKNPQRVSDLRMTELPLHVRGDGELSVVEGCNHIPFPIARIFIVKAPMGAVRGKHAHKHCTQFMICPEGAVEVVCDDGTSRKAFLLNRGDQGLLVPPSIWAEETPRQERSVLLVLCDRPYEVNDYILDYAEFLDGRRTESV
jgi:hypothetical protein